MGEVEVTWHQFWALQRNNVRGQNPAGENLRQQQPSGCGRGQRSDPTVRIPGPGLGMGEAGDHDDPLRGGNLLPVAFAQDGRNYRLPTEAEWEYAARGGTQTPYFFEGSPKKYSKETFWNKLFGADTTSIASYVVYSEDSFGKTQEPSEVRANPFGLKNMLGNVMEYCSDRYAADAYLKDRRRRA